jgi:hypothetical protein
MLLLVYSFTVHAYTDILHASIFDMPIADDLLLYLYIYITTYVISSMSDILLLLYVRLHINHMLNTWFYTL